MATNERFDFSAPLPALADLGRVHLVAIGGAGMSAVARLLLERGVALSGSDANDSATLAALRDQGARVWVGHDAAHLDGADTVVVSSAIREDNVELAAARERGLRVLHRAQALAVTTEGRRVVAVAGANGKTTTSSMLTVALDHAGAAPSFALGGELVGLGTNARVGAGPDFVVEADESDGSFLVYRPHIAVVTNVQPDHLDFYGSYDAVQEAYAAFAASVRDGGLLVACWDDPGSRALAEQIRGRQTGRIEVATYGYDEGADLRVRDTVADGLGTRTVIEHMGLSRMLVLAVPGRHNVLNACAAYAAASRGGGAAPETDTPLESALPLDDLLSGLATYDGARRRFEHRGTAAGVEVVDDYAHNAGKVSAVVEMAADLVAARGGRLHVAFQPHLYSRTRDFADGFAAGLARADSVVLLEIYGAREEPMPGVTSALIGERLTGGGEVVTGLDFAAAARWLAQRATAGDLILTVGAGDVTTLPPLVLAALEDQP